MSVDEARLTSHEVAPPKTSAWSVSELPAIEPHARPVQLVAAARDLRALSRRELQVLQSAMLGNTNKTIAFHLSIADATVRVLLWRASKKLGVHSRRDLVATAFRLMHEGIPPT